MIEWIGIVFFVFLVGVGIFYVAGKACDMIDEWGE